MRRGQCTFRPDYKEDRRILFVCVKIVFDNFLLNEHDHDDSSFPKTARYLEEISEIMDARLV